MSFAVVALGWALPAPAQTLDQIITRSIQASGGLQQLKAVHSERMTGRITLAPGVEGALTVELKRPNLIRTQIELPKGVVVQAYDGKAGWQMNPFGERKDATPVSAEEARNVAESADMDGPLVDWHAKGNRLTLLGRDTVEGRPAYKIKVTEHDGVERTIFVDVGTGLKVKWEGLLPIGGRPTLFASVFSDYRKVQGLKLPFRIRSKAEGSPTGQEIVFERIELNPDISDARFAMPADGTSPRP